jgi:hypothetical protein
VANGNGGNGGAKFKPERAAAILVEAAFTSDEKAARHWDVSVRSLLNWRNRLDEDPEFAAIFHHKKEIFEANWSLDLLPAMYSAIDYLKRASAETTYSPEYIHAVAGGLKILSDVRVTKEVIDARLAGRRGSTDEAAGEVDAEDDREDTGRVGSAAWHPSRTR